MSTGNKLNPFQISNKDDFDDGWDDWDDEEVGEEEHQALVFNGYDGSSVPASHPANQHRQNYQASAYPATKESFEIPKAMKIIFGGSIVVAILMLLSGKSNEDAHQSISDQVESNITQLVILGERHSGVPWLEETLGACYKDNDVVSTLQRPAFYFQDDPSSQDDDSIVVQLVLNPYD
eukprot:scaffold24611_cov166-Cylindrotheca_fusiformis.AAC.1